MKTFIGTGGWSYFEVPGMDPLEAYAKAFEYVEVNSTFYNYPQLETVKSWSRRVPDGFEFSVRCHQDLTHKHKMEPNEDSQKSYDKMVEICQTLKANILHLQTPRSLELSNDKVGRIRDFFSTVNPKGVRLAWEIRSSEPKLSEKVLKLMQDYNIIHCVDISKKLPAYKSDILYTRLFGKGAHNVYQFTDEELKEIDDRAIDLGAKDIYYTIHGIRMYKDAARMETYKQRGKFPKVTNSTGLASLEEVLREDAKFPCDKNYLIKHQGWKVIDFTVDKRIRAEEVLQKLPDKTFEDVNSVIEILKK